MNRLPVNRDRFRILELFDFLLRELRAAHLEWVRATKDLGLVAEPIIAIVLDSGGAR